MGTITYRAVRVPHDARSWAGIDARWRDGFIAGVRLAATDQPARVLGDGGVLLEEVTPGGTVVAPRQRDGGTPA